MATGTVRTCGVIAGYFDILGQGEVLRELRAIEDQFGSTDYEKKALALVHKLRLARMFFKTVFASDQANHLPVPPVTLDSEAHRAEYRRLRQRVIQSSFFSDSFLMVAPILDGDPRQYLLTVRRFLEAAAACQLQCLASGIPLRGGIVVGAGYQVQEDDEREPYYYGPVLVDAYHLESKVACYPSIVIGHCLVRELRLFQRAEPHIIPQNTAAGVLSVAQELAGSCLALMRTDVDRNLRLDPCSTDVQQLLQGPQFNKALASARAFANDEWRRHLARGDAAVAGKYAMLLQSLPEVRKSGAEPAV